MADRIFAPNAPENPFPLLPLRNGVILPGTVTTLAVGRPQSLALMRHIREGRGVIGVGVQRDPRVTDPGIEDLYPVGTFARVVRVARQGEKALMVSLQGLSRFELNSLSSSDPFWRANGTPLREPVTDEHEARYLAEALRAQLLEGDGALAALVKNIPAHESPGRLADRIAAGLELDLELAVEVLAIPDVITRLRHVIDLVGRAMTKQTVRKQIEDEVRSKLQKDQREHVLREHLKVVRKELGEDPQGDAVDKLEARLKDADLPDEVRKTAEREHGRLKGMSTGQPEASVIRNYLEWILDTPWNIRAETNDNLDGVQDKLDSDHYGLGDVKTRILEHLAVMKVSKNPRGTILCLVGPPGVSKTSLGQSIADATDRPFVRIALGGVRDQAEIRGHRRTYIGAIPGRIISGLKKAGAKNPVMLLDEIDKLSQHWGGSPEAALLEVLDPEQNDSFTDHYLELPFDLSETLFICTANSLGDISGPLRDRLEIVEVTGYTHDEKVRIARDHLIPHQLKEYGVAEDALVITDGALDAIVREYTREAGVRELKRQIVRLCRSLALKIARQMDSEVIDSTLKVDTESLHELLGKKKFRENLAEHSDQPGIATGLAWTPVGGDILFIETTLMPGKGKIQITGKLGEVMTESANAALSYVRSNADVLNVDASFLDSHDLHIHVPAGAVPKDGPSAGVTIFSAITSLLTGRPIRNDTAMTGECSLRGRVLPVGGIKSKVLAAHRAGLTRIILPSQNERDVEDIPEATRGELEFIFADDMSDVLAAALVDPDDAVAIAPLVADPVAVEGTTTAS